VRHERPAVLFDLDDTLYPRQRFLLSGFAAVARHLDRCWGVDVRLAFARLARAFRTEPGHELQALVGSFDLPSWVVPQLVEIIREHEPSLRLPRASRGALERLRDGWRIGIVTNGPPDIQARKIEALGLVSLVDEVVYAEAGGPGTGKPEPAAFVEAARRLGVCPPRAVFVGDDPIADIEGARRVGMHTIRVMRSGTHMWEAAGSADAVVESVAAVPSMAIGLIDGRRTYVV